MAFPLSYAHREYPLWWFPSPGDSLPKHRSRQIRPENDIRSTHHLRRSGRCPIKQCSSVARTPHRITKRIAPTVFDGRPHQAEGKHPGSGGNQFPQFSLCTALPQGIVPVTAFCRDLKGTTTPGYGACRRRSPSLGSRGGGILVELRRRIRL